MRRSLFSTPAWPGSRVRAERLSAPHVTLHSRRSVTVPERAQALELSERTMHRDITALRVWALLVPHDCSSAAC